MNGFLIGLCLVTGALIVLVVPTLVEPYVLAYGNVTVFDTGKAVLLCAALATIAGYISYRQRDGGPFLLQIFLAALLVRVLLGTLIYVFHGQDFFGGDALSYDTDGWLQLLAWRGDRYLQNLLRSYASGEMAYGWGMIYMVATIYALVGRNMLAVQFVNSVFGAATPVVIFLCAFQVFKNRRVARLAALAVAFFPSLVLWSSQGLKDGIIVFFLALAILATLKLGEKFSLKYIAILVFSLFALLSLRFYIFYMITAAIAGAFVIGMQKISAKNFARQFAIIVTIGLALTYLGVTRYATVHLGAFSSLERVQRSRLDAATTAQSGFARSADVSTSEGALTTIPVGLIYLFFAPFPWQLASLRQSITLPEMIVWWASFPLLILGLWFSIKYHLRQISPMLIFTVMLSLAYSVFQGNVGSAYRQRGQLLVFYFIFVAVGCVLLLERREARAKAELARAEPLTDSLAASPLPRR